MRRFIAALSSAALLASLFSGAALAAKPDGFDSNGNVIHSVSDAGFDQYGYNDTARIFSGLADGEDRNLDGTVWGDPFWANDLLVMKWNAAWDACNDNGQDNPDFCLGAWITNEWNGMAPGGSGLVWHYKIIWVGPCGAYGTPLSDGGFCIWGSYEVIMSQGAWNGGHWFETLAKPNGLGG